jgi:ABC-type multidrug transport system fused ATPase/permease subunit
LNAESTGPALAARFTPLWEAELARAKEQGCPPSLFKAFLRVFRKDLIVAIVLEQIGSVLRLGPIMLIPSVVNFVSDPTQTPAQGYMFALGVALTALTSAVVQGHAQLRACAIGVDIRTLIVYVVYAKMLTMATSSDFDSGKMVALMSSDTHRNARMFRIVVQSFAAILFLIAAAILLVMQLGPLGLVGLGIVLIQVPLNMKLSFLFARLRKEIVTLAQVRLQRLNELFGEIRTVRAYGWESSFVRRVHEARATELGTVGRFAAWRFGMLSMFMIIPALMASVLVMLYTHVSTRPFDAGTMFAGLATINVAQVPLALFPMGLGLVAGLVVTFRRTQPFLMIEDQSDSVGGYHNIGRDDPVPVELTGKPKKGGRKKADKSLATADVVIRNGLFLWERKVLEDGTTDDSAVALRDANLTVQRGQLACVVGRVGSGKSSLVNAIIGEAVGAAGVSVVRGRISYVPQSAWIANATLRDNVLMSSPFDEARYNMCIDCACLQADIDILVRGDQTEIGERGINLSGGQRARVSLARAAYVGGDVYVLDDPLSAVDNHVAKRIFRKLICGLMGDKTRIVVLNQIHFLPSSDLVVEMNNGTIAEVGTYQALIEKGGEFAELLQEFDQAHESDTSNWRLQSTDTVPAPEDAAKAKPAKAAKQADAEEDEEADGLLVTTEERASGLVPIKTYIRLIRLGPTYMFAAGIFFQLSGAVFRVVFEWFLSRWINDADQDPSLRTSPYYVGRFLSLTSVVIVSAIVQFIFFYHWLMVALASLHSRMLDKVLSRRIVFFDKTPLGRIMNRFSQDFEIVDMDMSIMLLQMTQQVLNGLAIFVLISLSAWPMIIVVVVSIIIFYYITHLFRHGLVSVQRIESVSRSPVFVQFSETSQGITTIRSLNLTDTWLNRMHLLLARNVRSFYYQLYVMQLFSTVLSVLSGLLLASIAFIAVAMRDEVEPALLAVSLSAGTTITPLLQFASRMLTQLEALMVSVERMFEFTDIADDAEPDRKKPEDAALTAAAGGHWPQSSSIEFRKVTLRYRPNLPKVLHSLSFKLKAGEKVGIVGRTGSGKSSCMQLLLRLVDPEAGSILVDGVDISTIGTDLLRSGVSIVPQEPVLFAGTIRFNLDPTDAYDNERLLHAIKLVGLAEAVADMGGLDGQVTEHGGNLSLGQAQLLCLARVIARRPKVVLLDEASSSVDIETDRLIQRVIRDEFEDSTILTVAHRLDSVIDYERVLVLDGGRLAQFDTPDALLQGSGDFDALAQELGDRAYRRLQHVASVRSGRVVVDADGTSTSSTPPLDESAAKGGKKKGRKRGKKNKK